MHTDSEKFQFNKLFKWLIRHKLACTSKLDGTSCHNWKVTFLDQTGHWKRWKACDHNDMLLLKGKLTS